MNYRFYDPLLAVVEEGISPELREFYTEKNKQNVQRMQDDGNLKGYLLKLMKMDQLFTSEDRENLFL